MKHLYIFALGFILLTTAADAKTVYLVRHAEKVNDGTKDPSLSLQGQQRAQNLADMLSHADIKHIFSTDYQRTKMTAQPLADFLDIEVQSYDPSDLAAFATSLKPLSGNVLVVGHSNTTPMLTFLLSNQPTKRLDDSHYDNVYQVIENNGTTTVNTFKSEPSQASLSLSAITPAHERFFEGELQFNMLFKGEVVGQSKHFFTNKNDQYHLKEITKIDGMNINATIKANIDAESLNPLDLHMSGTMGAPVDIDLKWQANNVQGHSSVPREPFKPKGKIILDKRVKPHTIERTSAIMMAHLMPVNADQTLRFNWFNGYDGDSNLITVSLIGEEQVKVPAGTFDTYKIKYSGGAPSQYFWIDKNQAKVVKIEVIHMPWTYELAATNLN